MSKLWYQKSTAVRADPGRDPQYGKGNCSKRQSIHECPLADDLRNRSGACHYPGSDRYGHGKSQRRGCHSSGDAHAQCQFTGGSDPTPTATPTPSESIQVTSVTIAYYDDPRTEFGVTIGGSPTPVTAKVYPVDVEAEVNWSVKEGGEDIISISIDDDGTCEVEGIGNGSAVLVAECGGVSAECTVYSG